MPRTSSRVVSSSRRRQNRVPHMMVQSIRPSFEPLERRTLLCAVHQTEPIVELRPDLIGMNQTMGGPESNAQIVWTNRGLSSDGFSVFGSQAETARNVMDQVLRDFERMIGSFNYGDGSTTFNLTVNTSGNHNGASANLNSSLGGKPKSGTVTMGRGGNGTGSGWYFDPTPHEHSEFMGNIVNAFSGDAPFGSPANGLGDFYTVAAAEITHVLGLFGNSLPLWSSKTTNTNVPDTAEGGGRGTFYVFQGPSIKHLLTSNNGGANGQNWGSAVHSAGPGVPVTFNNETYIGAQDIGNAVYEFSRRYIPNRAFALMFKDAFSYSTVDPSKFGTFYSVRNGTTGHVTVRGGSGASVDHITLSVSGSTLFVSVDPKVDVAGTGHLPGIGDLPAFVTEYDLSEVTGVTVNAGDGNDIITINGLPTGITVTVNADGGNDTINVNAVPAGATLIVNGGSGDDTINVGGGNVFGNIVGNLTIDGQNGIDHLIFDDSATTDQADYTITGTTLTKTGFAPITFSGTEGIGLRANHQSNNIHVASGASNRPVSIYAGGGDDTIRIGSGVLSNLPSLITVDGQGGNDSIVLDDSAATTGEIYFVNASNITRGGFGGLVFSNAETVKLQADAGNSAIIVDNTSPSVKMIIDAGAGLDTITVNETAPNSPVYIEGSAGNDNVNVNTDAAGSAGVVFTSGVTRLGNLTIGSGGTASVESGADKVVIVQGNLSINSNAQFDLADNAMVVDYTGSSPITSVRTLLANGFSNRSWNGMGGINSFVAAADVTQKQSLGYGEASSIFSSFPATFAGVQVDNTAVLVRHTLYGDVNLDRQVNLADFNRLAANFGQTGHWSQGDLNYDFNINLSDFNLLAANFGGSLAGPSAAPAPSGTGSSTRGSTETDDEEVNSL